MGLPKDLQNQAKRTLVWIALAVSVFVLFKVMTPQQAENVYRAGIFSGIRPLFDNTLAHLPFSLLWILPFGFIYWLYGQLSHKRLPWSVLLSVIRFTCFLFIAFYTLWGFNYKAPGLMDTLKVEAQDPSQDSLLALFYTEVETMTQLRQAMIPADSAREWLTDSRSTLKPLLQSHGYEARGRPIIRSLPKGLLLRFSTAGMYNPFLGEGYIDRGLHPLEKPFVTAHELSHAYGITEEGEANFWGLMTCLSSNSLYARYAGRLGLLRYILSDMRRANRDDYTTHWKTIPPAIQSDLIHISENHQRYPDILPDLRDWMYNYYLEAQGVSKGLSSYNDVVGYYLAWKSSPYSDAKGR